MKIRIINQNLHDIVTGFIVQKQIIKWVLQ
jgi:hypothetical protein